MADFNDPLTKEKLKDLIETIWKDGEYRCDLTIIGSSNSIKQLKGFISDKNINFQEVNNSQYFQIDEDTIYLIPTQHKEEGIKVMYPRDFYDQIYENFNYDICT